MRNPRLAFLVLTVLAAGCGDSAPATLHDGPSTRPDASVDGPPLSDGSVREATANADGKMASDGQTPTPDGKVTPTPDGKLPLDGQPPAVCGNGVREGTEQCDDGNKINLDGCDATCRFEQDLRVNKLLWQSGTDSVCTKNALGGAVQALALSLLQQSIDQGIADGSISILMRLLDLDDLAGISDASLTVGILAGTHASGTGYSGTADLDWWYTANAGDIDAQRIPLVKLPGKITASQLSAGPGKVSLPLELGGTTASLDISAVALQLPIGAAQAPLVSTGNSPGHLASEHLDPALTSFASAGAAQAGRMCGNTSAASLQAVPIPSQLVGSFGCAGFSASNTLLDVFVSGCSVPLFGSVITATQPDTDDPSVAPAGGGPPYSLTTNSTTKAVTGCKDKNGQTASLTSCLADAAYSTFFRVACGRVIIK